MQRANKLFLSQKKSENFSLGTEVSAAGETDVIETFKRISFSTAPIVTPEGT